MTCHGPMFESCLVGYDYVAKETTSTEVSYKNPFRQSKCCEERPKTFIQEEVAFLNNLPPVSQPQNADMVVL